MIYVKRKLIFDSQPQDVEYAMVGYYDQADARIVFSLDICEIVGGTITKKCTYKTWSRKLFGPGDMLVGPEEMAESQTDHLSGVVKKLTKYKYSAFKTKFDLWCIKRP